MTMAMAMPSQTGNGRPATNSGKPRLAPADEANHLFSEYV